MLDPIIAQAEFEFDYPKSDFIYCFNKYSEVIWLSHLQSSQKNFPENYAKRLGMFLENISALDSNNEHFSEDVQNLSQHMTVRHVRTLKSDPIAWLVLDKEKIEKNYPQSYERLKQGFKDAAEQKTYKWQVRQNLNKILHPQRYVTYDDWC